MWPPILGHQSMDGESDLLREVSYSRVHLLHHAASVCHIWKDGEVKNLPSWRDGDIRKRLLDEPKKSYQSKSKQNQYKTINISQITELCFVILLVVL